MLQRINGPANFCKIKGYVCVEFELFNFLGLIFLTILLETSEKISPKIETLVKLKLGIESDYDNDTACEDEQPQKTYFVF